MGNAHAGWGALPASIGLAARWSGGEWEPLISIKRRSGGAEEAASLMDRRMARLAGASDGHLWMAADFQHAFREYARDGRLLAEIVVGTGEVKRAADAEQRLKALREEAKQLSTDKARVSIFEETVQATTRGIAEGRDGRMFFLVLSSDGGSEVALERFEPASGIFERLPVAMPDPGRTTMAAGKDGLYVAAYSAERGIWRFAWDRLQEASWTPVDATVDGAPIEKPKPSRPAPAKPVGKARKQGARAAGLDSARPPPGRRRLEKEMDEPSLGPTGRRPSDRGNALG